MAKKTKKKASVKRRISKIHLRQNPDEPKIEKILVENFVSLQKVITNLSVKLNNLTDQISQLLSLFEISAKALAKKDYPGKDDKDNIQIIKKMDNLLEQNKIIARGLTLLHEPESTPQIQRPLPPKPVEQNPSANIEGYQKSISPQGQPKGPIQTKQKFTQTYGE